VASTSGLVQALSVAAQAHTNQPSLLHYTQHFRPQKPLVDVILSSPTVLSGDLGATVNTIVNNWADIEISVALLNTPERAKQIVSSPFFESFGHAAFIHYRSVLNLLAGTIDSQVRAFPDVPNWDAGFDELQHRQVPNYSFGSDILVPPFGRHAICEAQARIIEIQYVFNDFARKKSWPEIEQLGYWDPYYSTGAPAGRPGGLSDTGPRIRPRRCGS
jgi:hypothetical protein